MYDIRAALKLYLRERGITQRYLADRVNMSYESMSRLLNKKRELTADELFRIFEVLDIGPGDLGIEVQHKAASGY